MKTTLNKIRAHHPCRDGWEKLLRGLGKTQSDDEPLRIDQILDHNGLDDALWCLRAVEGCDLEIRLYAVWCARRVQNLMTDPRSIAALDVAERHARGKASDEELASVAARAAEASVAARAAGEASALASALASAAGEASPLASPLALASVAWAARAAAAAAVASKARAAEAVAWAARAAAAVASKARAAAAVATSDTERAAQAEELRRICREMREAGR
jgi:hypothetical protein